MLIRVILVSSQWSARRLITPDLHCSSTYFSYFTLDQGYKVYYALSPAELPVSLWTVHQVDNPQLTTITNLMTNRTYTISVLAFTSIGDGPLSEPIQVKTQQGGVCAINIPNACT